MASGGKHKGLKTFFVILAVIVAVFALWILIEPDDEYDRYDYGDDYENYVNRPGEEEVTAAPTQTAQNSNANNTTDSKNPGGSQNSENIENADKDAQNTSDSAGETNAGDTTSESNASPYAAADLIRSPRAQLKGDGTDVVTVMVYMNGSNLETDSGEATEDLTEIIAAGYNPRVNVVVQTIGTKKWSSTYGISSKKSQRYKVTDKGLTLVDDTLGQEDVNSASTLQNYISWAAKEYPADRYILMFWDHGGGPVYGFGYDDVTESEDSLTLDEMQSALKGAGVYFDFIGMDCCIMSSLEVCCALYDYCDYMILSEDFESGYGWSYTKWLKSLYANTSIGTVELGKIAIDAMVAANKEQGEDAILALLDEGYMKILYSTWVNFAYANEEALLNTNFSRVQTRGEGDRVNPMLYRKGFFSNWSYDDYNSDDENYAMSDYYVTDIMAVAENISADQSEALSAALNKAIVYMASYGDSSSLTGISVTIPYGDSSFYSDLKSIFTNCGFDSGYVEWLEQFVSSSGSSSFFDYDDWDDSWSGWDDYEDDYDWDDWGQDFGDFYDDYYGDYDDYYDDFWFDWFDWGWSDDSWEYDYGPGFDFDDDYYDSYGDYYDNYFDSYEDYYDDYFDGYGDYYDDYYDGYGDYYDDYYGDDFDRDDQDGSNDGDFIDDIIDYIFDWFG